MDFPKISDQEMLKRLELPDGVLNMVMDTDTYNEVDDQFALAYALSSPERLNVQAVYAAPFFNSNSTSPADGMERSYEEIHRVLQHMGITPAEGFVRRGAPRYLESLETPCRSEATDDLIARAMGAEELLYVVATGAITNIASAILLEPRIVDKIVVVWLGGHAHYWPQNNEFNLIQDVLAAQVVFNCGVPVIQMPCENVVTHLQTTVAELEKFLCNRSGIGSYLTGIVRDALAEYTTPDFPGSRIIWDVVPVAYLVNQNWVNTKVVHTPILTDGATWSVDESRHFMRVATRIDRDRIFADLFSKLS
jgi:purine nucleosidase